MVASAIDLQYVLGKISECTRTGSRKENMRYLCPILSLFKSLLSIQTALKANRWPLAKAPQHTSAPSAVDVPPTSLRAPLQISALAPHALLMSCKNILNPKLIAIIVSHQAIESFALTVKEIAQMLQSFGMELAETELPDDMYSIERILALRTEKYYQLKVCLIGSSAVCFQPLFTQQDGVSGV